MLNYSSMLCLVTAYISKILAVYRSAASEGTSDFFPIKPLQKETPWIGGEQVMPTRSGLLVCLGFFKVGSSREVRGNGNLQTLAKVPASLIYYCIFHLFVMCVVNFSLNPSFSMALRRTSLSLQANLQKKNLSRWNNFLVAPQGLWMHSQFYLTL